MKNNTLCDRVCHSHPRVGEKWNTIIEKKIEAEKLMAQRARHDDMIWSGYYCALAN